jgi:hypothetical protein
LLDPVQRRDDSLTYTDPANHDVRVDVPHVLPLIQRPEPRRVTFDQLASKILALLSVSNDQPQGTSALPH